MVRAGLARPASSQLLDYVPASAVSLDMRGSVELAPVFRWMRDRWRADAGGREEVLWLWNVVEAAVGLSVEHDVLSWLGSEHVSMQVALPGGTTESVRLFRLADTAGANKCIERATDVFRAAGPRLIAALQQLLLDAQVPLGVDVQLLDAGRDFPTLHRLDVMIAPFVNTRFVFGTLGDLAVVATSEEALQACLDAASGKRDGLESRPLMAGLVGRDDLCGVRLAPLGAGFAADARTIRTVAALVRGGVDSFAAEDPEVAALADTALDFVNRVASVLDTVDFLGDAVTCTEIREGGLARYEVTRVELLFPEPSVGPAPRDSLADTPEPPADVKVVEVAEELPPPDED